MRVSLAISLGGIFRGGAIYVDAVSWPEDRGYRRGETRDGYLSGTVQRVDYRGGMAEVRDDRSGRVVRVDFRGDRRSRLSLEDVRRGDAIELSGVWSGGVFAAYDIEAIRDR